MNVHTILDFVSRLAPFDSNRRVAIYGRGRSGDTEVQIQEKANGEREIVVLQRVASVDVSEFESDNDTIECPHCGAENHRESVEHQGCCHDCRGEIQTSVDCPHCEETVNALAARYENDRHCPECDFDLAPEMEEAEQ